MTTKPSSRSALTAAGLVAAVVLGIGLGAAAFSVLGDGGSTVVREVTVPVAQPTAESGLSISQIYDRTSTGVVEITATSGGSGFGTPASSSQGSGFVYDDAGHIVTNEHVVANADSLKVMLWNGSEYTAKLVGSDPSTDLAVLQIDAPRSVLNPLTLADSSAVAVGDPVLAIGSPFGLEGTLTQGIVSALHRDMTAPNRYTITNTIQTDAAINHGNSGGPLLDGSGRVIGVTSQIESESGGSDGVGFAIPSNTVRSIADQLIASGKVEHAYLGIAMVAVPNGIAITQVRPGTPAEKAGLRAATGTRVVGGQEIPSGGDVIVAFNGKKMTSEAELQSAVDAERPGDQATITILRNGRHQTVHVTLAVRP